MSGDKYKDLQTAEQLRVNVYILDAFANSPEFLNSFRRTVNGFAEQSSDKSYLKDAFQATLDDVRDQMASKIDQFPAVASDNVKLDHSHVRQVLREIKEVVTAELLSLNENGVKAYRDSKYFTDLVDRGFEHIKSGIDTSGSANLRPKEASDVPIEAIRLLETLSKLEDKVPALGDAHYVQNGSDVSANTPKGVTSEQLGLV